GGDQGLERGTDRLPGPVGAGDQVVGWRRTLCVASTFLARTGRREEISPPTHSLARTHGSHSQPGAIRRRARGAAPTRRPEEAARRRQPGGRWLPAAPHLRG